jgi:hypothetical protein
LVGITNSWWVLIPLDPAVDWRYRHGQSQRFAAFANLPADRLLISYGHNHQLTYFDQEHYCQFYSILN